MLKTLRINKPVVFILLFYLLLLSSISNAESLSSGEVLDVSQVILDPNGVGVVLDQDISSYLDGNHFIYILITLNQRNISNGLYMVGFESENSTIVSYSLGESFNPNLIWFNSSSGLIINFDSVVYVDILDYLVAFGQPDSVSGLILKTSLNFEDMTLNINSIVNEFQESFIPANSSENTSLSQLTTTNTSDFSIDGLQTSIVLVNLLSIIGYRKFKKKPIF